MHTTINRTVILALLSVINAVLAATDTAAESAPTGSTFPSGYDMKSGWSSLRPYADAEGFSVPSGVPIGCELAEVHVLHRHAQRYPSSYETDTTTFASKIANYTSCRPGRVGHGPLEFLNRWKYLLGTDVLLPFGAATEDTSGAAMWDKYGRLLYRAPAGQSRWKPELNVFPNGTARRTPVFRTTDSQRILESARWWASGFFGNEDAKNSESQYDLVIMPEGFGVNNTLGFGSCPKGRDGAALGSKLLHMYSQAPKERLSMYMPADFNLTDSDVHAMMSLCPYETAALGDSAFCNLFTEAEWKRFGYLMDAESYGSSSFGSTTGRASGIGYVNELVARLQNRLIYTSHSSINVTFDDNTATFPVAGQPLYMDMTHSFVITGAMTALGMDYFRYPSDHGFPASEDPVERHFRMDQIIPFGGHLVSEIWRCPAGTDFRADALGEMMYSNPDLSGEDDTKEYIRWVVNNAPVPTDGVSGCENAQNGFCAVESFLRGVPKMRELAEFTYACFGNYSVEGEVGNGRPPVGPHS